MQEQRQMQERSLTLKDGFGMTALTLFGLLRGFAGFELRPGACVHIS